MDGSRFDTLAKTLATTPLTRVTVMRGLAASAAALAGARLAAEPGTAKKDTKNEKERKVCVCGADGTVGSCRTKKVKADKVKKLLRRNPCASKGKCQGRNPCATQTLSGCTPNCERKICGPDGCGGSCGTCGADLVCANGQCASSCPGGQKNCGGNCIPNNQCCTGNDCPSATPDCCGGACVNTLTDLRNCGACGRRCTFNEQCFDGECFCGNRFDPCSTLEPSFGASCCLASITLCQCSTEFWDIRGTCTFFGSTDPADCPVDTTPCVATTNSCGPIGPARICCPRGTTCSAIGTCLIA